MRGRVRFIISRMCIVKFEDYFSRTINDTNRNNFRYVSVTFYNSQVFSILSDCPLNYKVHDFVEKTNTYTIFN